LVCSKRLFTKTKERRPQRHHDNQIPLCAFCAFLWQKLPIVLFGRKNAQKSQKRTLGFFLSGMRLLRLFAVKTSGLFIWPLKCARSAKNGSNTIGNQLFLYEPSAPLRGKNFRSLLFGRKNARKARN